MRAAQRTYTTRKQNDPPTNLVNGSKAVEPSGGVEFTEETLREERQKMIEERQNEMARVLDKHDDLVREDFHLRHFRLMISYDPKIAKADNAQVFLKHKAQYDLLDNASTSETSRRTRRARNERAETLQAGSVSAPPVVPASQPVQDDQTFWRLLADTKSKHKGKGRAKDFGSITDSISATPVYGRKGKTKEFAPFEREPVESMPSTSESVSSSVSHVRRRLAMGPPPGVPYPRKKRKLEQGEAAAEEHVLASPHVQQDKGVSDRVRTLRTSVRQEKSVVDIIASLPPAPPSPSIKRIKLIVRKPIPTFSSPLQKPPPPKYGESLTALLSSYSAPEGTDLDEHRLKELIQDDLKIWREIDSLRQQGRMLYRPPDTDSSPKELPELNSGRQPDAWDSVLEAVQQRAQAQLVNGEYVAAQVASRVQAYWDARAIREDKVRAQDERRLRALAKATIRMVTAEWKKVVFHIREQERLKREAEERRRGHEHLDAILDQSGQLLEAQQVDLTKGDLQSSRSRSSSLADTLGRWASASPPGEDAESNSEAAGVASADDSGTDSGSDSDEELDSRFLVVGSRPGLTDEETGAARGEGSVPSPRIHDPDDHNESFASLPSESKETHPPSVEFDLVYPEENGSLVENTVSPLSPLPDKTTSNEKNSFALHVKPLSESNGRIAVKALLVRDSGSDSPSRRSSPTSHTSRHSSPSLAGDLASVRDAATDAPDSPPPDTPVTQSEFDMDLHTATSNLEASSLLDDQDVVDDDDVDDVEDPSIPAYLRPYAVTPVEWDPQSKVKDPLLLRGNLRPYQHAGLEWLASLHTNNVNGILADEMGLGKTIQTIALLAHLACDRGIWGPHLIVVPTSVLLNWEMEFKKFMPGFKVLSYHGNTKRRKELRQGWNNKYHFNVCVTSYTLASRDAHVFKRKPWYYMILDEAHMIKNFKSQRWNILLMFRSFRRLLLTGTPLQNNLTELWALLQFLMSGTNFANLKEFGDWFANPLEKAVEMGTVLDEETQQRVAKLHSVLRPYLLRRLKRDVEKELPSKFEHLIMCPLSKRQRFLYDEFMSRKETRYDLQSGVYQKIANILMQLRKVVNHPDLFEVRPIKTSFAMSRSAIADYEIKELLVRRQLLQEDDEQTANLKLLGFAFIDRQGTSILTAYGRRSLDGTSRLPFITELPDPPPRDVRTIAGYRKYKAYMEQAAMAARWAQIGYVNRLRCNEGDPVFSAEVITLARRFYQPLLPHSALDRRSGYLETSNRVHRVIKSYLEREDEIAEVVDRFAFVTPSVVARDLPSIALSGHQDAIAQYASDTNFDAVLHRSTVKLQIAFPDPSLLQYDCGKLQELARLLRERKAGGHRILIFTQMTRILDILEIFLNLHGYLYLRLDGATKIEDRQYITERFNTDPRIFCFISSSRSGGVGINLTGADTVIFYDSDFNPQMDRQCEDRAHRIGQIRDVHIYRFISSHTVEEALLRKANQKRSLDDLVIQKGEFDWRTLFGDDGSGAGTGSGLGLGVGTVGGSGISVSALEKALGEFEDSEDRVAREVATKEEVALTGADEEDFDDDNKGRKMVSIVAEDDQEQEQEQEDDRTEDVQDPAEGEEEEEDEGGTTVDYMLSFVQSDLEFFNEWRI